MKTSLETLMDRSDWGIVMIAGHYRLGSTGVSTGVALRQRIQQCLRLLQISRVKALGEPAVDGCQQRVGFGALALLLPQARQAGGGS